MSRFDPVNASCAAAEEETKIGVHALVAIAQAIIATEDDGSRHIDGAITVDR